MKKIRIMFTGGGSGGHIYPLLAVLEKIKKHPQNQNLDFEFHYFGPSDNWNNLFLGAGDIEIHSLLSSKIRRYFSPANLLDFPKFIISLFQALFKMFWIMPDVVFSKGGPGAFPVVFSAWFYRIPVIIHESDATPGITNLLSAKFAKKIAVSFPSVAKYFNPKKTFITGTPIREELLENQPFQPSAKEELHFDPAEPLILILGGSQGSTRINEFVLTNLKELITDTQIIHQTGYGNFQEVEKLSRAAQVEAPLEEKIKHRYLAVPYLEDKLKTALAAADLVISRAGSGTIFEISAFKKPAILIPLEESANDHQRLNAFEFSTFGGGVVIEEENLLPHIFLNQIHSLIKNPATLQKMGDASAKFFRPNASELIAEEIIGQIK